MFTVKFCVWFYFVVYVNFFIFIPTVAHATPPLESFKGRLSEASSGTRSAKKIQNSRDFLLGYRHFSSSRTVGEKILLARKAPPKWRSFKNFMLNLLNQYHIQPNSRITISHWPKEYFTVTLQVSWTVLPLESVTVQVIVALPRFAA